MRIAFVSTSLPRRCGIATFTGDLISASKAADPSVRCVVAAIDEPNSVRAYGPEVRWRIKQGNPRSYREVAEAINASNVDAVNVQHEFALYGVWHGREGLGSTAAGGIYEDHLRPFLEELRKPVVTTLHSVPPQPSPSFVDAIRSTAKLSHKIVVMAETAVGLLKTAYGVESEPIVIPHGMPVVDPKGRHRLKAKLGLEGRLIISTFGLVDPRKGLEYVIEAMPEIIKRYPNALYLIAGQTHPELLRQHGEEYRNRLVELIGRLGLDGHVGFVNQYMTQRDIIDYLLATDVYITPYLDPNQITSGTLSYALGAGKAIISTPYLHAVEALADGRGILVDFRDSSQTAAAVLSIFDNPEYKASLEEKAYAYSREQTWPKSAERFLAVMRELTQTVVITRPERRASNRPIDVGLGHRLPENPLITAADVKPSLPELEVVAVFNAAAARVGDETILLLRVAERPRSDIHVPHDALTLDLTSPEPHLRPLPPGIPMSNLVGSAYLDVDQSPPRVVVAYIPRDTVGLDLSDPRTIRYRGASGGSSFGIDEFSDYLTQMSHLRVARSTDGVHFEVDEKPTITPLNHFEEYGCEDARATFLEGQWHISYVSVSRLGMTTSRLTTKDFRTFERHGVMFLPDHKDVVLFPDKIGGRYVSLTRPMSQSFGRVLGIWIAYSDDLSGWGGHRPLALPRWGMWDEARTGAGSVPFRVPEGWLELYHGVDRNSRYTMGALLLDAEDPSRVIARSPRPILVPHELYERSGFFNDTVFSCGHVFLDDDQIRMYYGAADQCTAAADFSVRDIIDHLQPC